MPKVVENLLLAVNITDLTRLDTLTRQLVLGNKLDLNFPVHIGPDEAAAMFKTELLEAAMACDVLRSEAKRSNRPVRVYLKRRSVWSRLPADVPLTSLIDNQCCLNPDIFPLDEGNYAEPDPLVTKPIEF